MNSANSHTYNGPDGRSAVRRDAANGASNGSKPASAAAPAKSQPNHQGQGVIQRLMFLISEMVRVPPALLGDGREDATTKTSSIISDLRSQGLSRIPTNIGLIMDIISGITRGGLIDDREYTVFPNHALFQFITNT